MCIRDRVIFQIDVRDPSLGEIQKRLKVKLRQDTIFLLKNSRTSIFYPLDIEFEDQSDFVYRYYRGIQKVDKSRAEALKRSFSLFTSDKAAIVFYCPKEEAPADKEKKKEIKAKLETLFLDSLFVSNRNLHWLKATSKEVGEALDLPDAKYGDLFFVTRSSRLNEHKSNRVYVDQKMLVFRVASLENKMRDILKDLISNHRANFTFGAVGFNPDSYPFELVIEVDKNRLSSQREAEVIDQIAKMKKELEKTHPEIAKTLVCTLVHRNTKGDSEFNINIYDRKSNSTHINYASQTEFLKKEDLEEIEKGKRRSFVYRFENKGEVSAENLLKFVVSTFSGENKKEYFQSKHKTLYRTFSRKIVGLNFKESVLDNDENQVVLFYSKQCPGSVALARVYEELAGDLIKEGSAKVVFNRINSTKNSSQYFHMPIATPVLAVYRKGQKSKPLFYRPESFSKGHLRSFIESTTDSNYTPDPSLERLFGESRGESKSNA
eukprot:TRINITY_DN9674_c0_g1_i1.p1 TRINITY_DN9674_c0_g1~~TRINITY_DN9674_c0_g1_i1.p1  ORF type:complete len:510 (-),score=140.12 TRINITY_DN9674_c0_g1_i1:12-1484(-)